MKGRLWGKSWGPSIRPILSLAGVHGMVKKDVCVHYPTFPKPHCFSQNWVQTPTKSKPSFDFWFLSPNFYVLIYSDATYELGLKVRADHFGHYPFTRHEHRPRWKNEMHKEDLDMALGRYTLFVCRCELTRAHCRLIVTFYVSTNWHKFEVRL